MRPLQAAKKHRPQAARRCPGRKLRPGNGGPSGSFVAVGIVRLPAPAVAAHILERILGVPAEDARTLVRAGVHGRQVARTARRDPVRHMHVVGRLEGVHHLEHAVALAGAEVEDALARVLRHVGDRRDVAAREVHDVDIVAHARAVRRVIVVAKDAQALAAADGRLRDIGHEVVRHAARVLADEAARVRADGVEVAQQHDRPARVGHDIVAQDLLADVLRPAIGIRAVAGAGRLVERHLIVAGVHRRRRGENDLPYAVVTHRLAERDRRAEVVVVVFQRHLHRLAHGLEAREMNDAVDLLLGENAVEPGAVAHVHLIKFQRPARDLFDPSARLCAAVDEIVHHDDIHALLKQLHARVAADVAHAAGHQYGHAPYPLLPADVLLLLYITFRRSSTVFPLARNLPGA